MRLMLELKSITEPDITVLLSPDFMSSMPNARVITGRLS